MEDADVAMSGLRWQEDVIGDSEEGDINELLCLITGIGEDQMIGGGVGFVLRDSSSFLY